MSKIIDKDILKIIRSILNTTDDISSIIVNYSHPYFDLELYKAFLDLYSQYTFLKWPDDFDSHDNFKITDNNYDIMNNMFDMYYYPNDRNTSISKNDVENGINKLENESILRSNIFNIIIQDRSSKLHTTIKQDNFISFRTIRDTIFTILDNINKYICRLDTKNLWKIYQDDDHIIKFISLNIDGYGVPTLTHEMNSIPIDIKNINI